MHASPCDHCGQLLFFANSLCLRCSSPIGYAAELDRLVPLDLAKAEGFIACANRTERGCNWLVPEDAEGAATCRACRLTRAHPGPTSDPADQDRWLDVERAKRQLTAELLLLGLPVIDRHTDPELGLAFDLLSGRDGAVTTGHADGVITLDLAEADDLHRETERLRLDEPYRTVLGHLRHEIGHHYWQRLVSADPALLDACRQVFGDDRADYADALAHNYEVGPPADWQERHVSTYAAAHPWEDFAETFAHLLHITDGLRTARAVGLQVDGAADDAYEPETGRAIDLLVARWLRLTLALNAMSRSIGRDDLYPFVLSETVIDKLGWVHDLVRGR